MKKNILTTMALILMGASTSSPASAFMLDKQKASTPTTTPSLVKALTSGAKSTSTTTAPTVVQKAVANLDTFNASVNTNADYYIYLQSASWCGPCQAEMPGIAKEYLQMKSSKKVELILISWDQNKTAAKGFVQSHKATFPVVMLSNKNVAQLPGFKKANGIPSATIVDKNGREIITAHGSVVMDWKTFCKVKGTLQN